MVATVNVLFFSYAADRMKTRRQQFEVEEGCTIAAFYQQTLQSWLKEPVSAWMFSVNQEWAALDTPLKSGDEVAVIPPVSGG